MQRRDVLTRLAAGALTIQALNKGLAEEKKPGTMDHLAWVTESLERMATIKLGMTREDLCRVFTTEGGLSTGLNRTFVYCDCPLFKVDVEFEAVGRQGRDGDGRVTLIEDGRDIICRVSRPFLQFPIMD